MTKNLHRKTSLVPAIAPSTRGFGYAVTEGDGKLVNWGVKSATGNKNAESLKKADKLLALYRPAVLVLPHASAKGSRRSARIRKLTKDIVEVAGRRKIKVQLLSREQIMLSFFEDGKGTKHTIARILAMRFPEELGHRLPQKRKHYKSEDYRMGIFDAVALTLVKQLKKK